MYFDFNSTTCFSKGVSWPPEEEEDDPVEGGASVASDSNDWNCMDLSWSYSISKLSGSLGLFGEDEEEEEEEAFGWKNFEIGACIPLK